MHLTMAFIASIGKLFSDGGLHNTMTVSEVYADASVSLMLQGKQYARGIKEIRLVHEALFHLFLSAAETFAMKNKLAWLDDETTHFIRDLENTFKMQFPEFCTAVCKEIEMRFLVYADAPVSLMLQGKQYARGIRDIRLIQEALFHLFLSAAETFAMKNKLPWLDDETTHFIRDLENTFKMRSPEACTAVCQEIEMRLSSSLLNTMEKFKDT